MKKYLWLIIPAVLLIILLVNKNTIAAKTYDTLYQSPCDTPREYRLGTVDPQFSLTNNEAREAISEAAATWKKAYGKNLFIYNPKAELSVNFVYDDRQALNTTINKQNETLKQKDSTLQPEIEAHEQKVADLQRRIDQLNKEIDDWNGKGGAPEDVYNSLKSRQEQLQRESNLLNAEADSLSIAANNFNSEVKELNQNVASFNESLQLKPEGGLYSKDENGEKIDIYIYSTRTELLNILTHEMGHALGMVHVSDSHAIMYPKTNEAIKPTDADVQQLDIVCQKRNVLEDTFTSFILGIRRIINNIYNRS